MNRNVVFPKPVSDLFACYVWFIPVAIGEILYAGLSFNPRVRVLPQNVRSSVSNLFDELEERGVDYLLVGGVALLSYVEGRNTQGIDLIISLSDLGRVSWTVLEKDNDFAKATFEGVRVDLLLTSNSVFNRVRREQGSEAFFGERKVRCVTREGLLILKLYALPALYRQGKIARATLYEADIRMLLENHDIGEKVLLEPLHSELLASDIQELQKILEEQRPRRRFS